MKIARFRWVPLAAYVAWLCVAYDFHFLDYVNLAFHEAGHIFLAPFGMVLGMLGGTLGQLFFPGACAVHFLRLGQRASALVCGVWLAESLMYVAHYMADAREMNLPLVGGEIHDWNWLLAGSAGSTPPVPWPPPFTWPPARSPSRWWPHSPARTRSPQATARAYPDSALCTKLIHNSGLQPGRLFEIQRLATLGPTLRTRLEVDP